MLSRFNVVLLQINYQKDEFITRIVVERRWDLEKSSVSSLINIFNRYMVNFIEFIAI